MAQSINRNSQSLPLATVALYERCSNLSRYMKWVQALEMLASVGLHWMHSVHCAVPRRIICLIPFVTSFTITFIHAEDTKCTEQYMYLYTPFPSGSQSVISLFPFEFCISFEFYGFIASSESDSEYIDLSWVDRHMPKVNIISILFKKKKKRTKSIPCISPILFLNIITCAWQACVSWASR